MSSLTEYLRLLDLLTPEQPRIASAHVQAALGVPAGTADDYLAALADVDLLARDGSGFILGAAAIRLTDRMRQAADPPAVSLPPSPAPPSSEPPVGLRADLAGASDAQRRVAALIAAGPRGSVPSPFLAMLSAPPLAEAIQGVGAVLRFGSILPDALRELAILTTAVAVDCGYEWNHHVPIALAAGLSPSVMEIVRSGGEAEGLGGAEAIFITLCRDVVAHGQAAPDILARAIEQLGKDGATELLAIAGYYPLLAIFIKSAGFDQAFEAVPSREGSHERA